MFRKHPFILFYQVGCLNYKNRSSLKKLLKSKNLNFILIKTSILKKSFKNNIFKNTMSGPIIVIFATGPLNIAEISGLVLGSNTFLLMLKFKNKFYSAPRGIFASKTPNTYDLIFFLKNLTKRLIFSTSLRISK